MSDIPPLVLVRGPEELLADRAVAAVLADLKVEAPDLDVVRVGPDYHSGQLVMDTSPSLFGGSTCVVIEALHEASEDLHADLLDYLAAPAEHVTLVVRHAGGPRGKKVLDALVAGKARIFECPAVKSDRDKSDFVTNEFRRAGRKVTPEAVRALVEAVGKDLRELAASCAQLVVDTEGSSTTGSSRPTTGQGRGHRLPGRRCGRGGPGGEALRLLRHAIATGVDPVPIVAVLAGQLRQVVRVGSASRGPARRSWRARSVWRPGRSTRPAGSPRAGLPRAWRPRSRPLLRRTPRSKAEVATPSTRWSGPSSPSPRPGPPGGADAGRPIERRAARAATGRRAHGTPRSGSAGRSGPRPRAP